MRMHSNVLVQLLKPIDRRLFKTLVKRHNADAYDKSLKSWDHLVALVYAQLAGVGGLRALVPAFNASAGAHYHLGVAALKRSTLSDANARRPVGVFADLFAALSHALDRRTRAEGADMIRLIDSTPVPLSRFFDFARANGRIHGMKMHLVHDPCANRPMRVEVTPANVNDIAVGKKTPIEAGATYVFDKGYCDYAWWTHIAAMGAFFVTRPKNSMRLKILAARPLEAAQSVDADGFTVIEDAEVALASKGDSKLPMPLRRIIVEREDARRGAKRRITLIVNDMRRGAHEIAALYKGRWAIELLFRWIKQHLNIRSFLGKSENAVRLQLLAAMIAFALLRLAACANEVAMPMLRFAELVGRLAFERRPIDAIEKPPPKYPARRRLVSARQIEIKWP